MTLQLPEPKLSRLSFEQSEDIVRAGWAVAIPFLIAATCGALAITTATSVASQSSRASPALWTIKLRSSRHETQIERICLNDLSPRPELRTCAGKVSAPDDDTGEVVSCSNGSRSSNIKQTMSTVTSNDGRTVRDLTEQKSNIPGFPRVTWSESTMTYSGACPVALKPEQPFVIIKPDGTVVDPFQATVCMVGVLNTVQGVTEPSAGYFRDPDLGPLPFVRYTYPSRRGDKATITFTSEGDLASPAKWSFLAVMSGLFSPSDNGPDEFGADKIMKLWRAQCGVKANILFP